MQQPPSTIRSIYFYLVSLIALGFIVGSSVYLLNYAAKAGVFKNADFTYRGTPPGIFAVSPKIDSASPAFAVTCQDKCSLTDSDRLSISDWQQNYKAWREQPSAKTNRARGLVNALSFLVVALPIFFFHFRTAQKDYKQANDSANGESVSRGSKTLRSIYFYLVALAAVVMFIISAGVTINTVLKTWVVKDANTKSSASTPVKLPGTPATTDTQGVSSLLACADKCSLSAEVKQELQNWQTDYTQAQTELDNQNKNDWQRTLATSMPFLLVSIPLFWLHWLVIQKDRKKQIS
ncbi:MAG: DUF5671 domain-containing protein [Patescibacteria group bacterium]